MLWDFANNLGMCAILHQNPHGSILLPSLCNPRFSTFIGPVSMVREVQSLHFLPFLHAFRLFYWVASTSRRSAAVLGAGPRGATGFFSLSASWQSAVWSFI